MNKIIFLDRDGVINNDSPAYIKNWSEFKFLDGSLDAIKRLTQECFDIIVITNQSIISRKMATQTELDELFSNMKKEIISAGGKIKDIFYCPHLPDDCCDCRKPEPGLIFQAKEKYGIDLSKTYMVGDNVKDIECAINAGCGSAILVRTGSGINAEEELKEKDFTPNHIAKDLNKAADWIIHHYSQMNSSPTNSK